MPKYIIEMYGIPREITDLEQVEIEIEDGAGIGDIIKILRDKIPALEGPVIRAGEDRLVDVYNFNINGRFYYDGMDLNLQCGDHIALLLTPLAGG